MKRGDHFESDWVFLCGFVPMLGQPGERNATIDPDGWVTIHYDVDQPVDVEALQGVLERDKTTVWADATVHAEEPFDRVWLHLAAVHDGTARIQAGQKAVATGLCTPAIASRSPALVDGDSLAYFTIRRTGTSGRWQLGAIGHGPAGYELAANIVEQIAAWDQDRTADPHLVAYPTGTPMPGDQVGKVIVKPDVSLGVRF
ncbi:hypothetical protein [Phytohabitans kaempferiae]|uniref:Uncharacterized protein n=1 Tax=Phytohabitans kaempferiae TaxID=1620943 RepID=A0ABV6M2Y9_9ACTN